MFLSQKLLDLVLFLKLMFQKSNQILLRVLFLNEYQVLTLLILDTLRIKLQYMGD